MGNFIDINNTSNIIINQSLKQQKSIGPIVYEYNELTNFLNIDNKLGDFNTNKLSFDLEHPVDMEIQPTYDGTVNIILNDGKNKPLLINSRFAPTGLNTYKIPELVNDSYSKIYKENQFEQNTTLQPFINNIVKVDLINVLDGGNLKVGNYRFYFKLQDVEGNESDFIAESGVISCYIGNINKPKSIKGGLEDENSFKMVYLKLSNLPINTHYKYIKVYFSRTTGTQSILDVTSNYEIINTFEIVNETTYIQITGFERILECTEKDINNKYYLISNASSITQCQNRLFLGGITNINSNEKELTDLSLRICPYLYTKDNIGFVNYNYEDSSGGYEYYNPLNIYNKLGYWDDEIYRFGIVYILKDGSLSNVYNIRGTNNLNNNSIYSEFELYLDELKTTRNYIQINKNLLVNGNSYENCKGVVKINYSENQFNSNGINPIGIKFKISSEVKLELEKYVKGFFFVRQNRIPTTLCQAGTIGMDLVQSNLPLIPYNDNYLYERFINDDKYLTHTFSSRISYYKSADEGKAAICPEYEINQGKFNNLFYGQDFVVKKSRSNVESNQLKRDNRHFYIESYKNVDEFSETNINIIGVPEEIKAINGKQLDIFYSSKAGEAVDATEVAWIGTKPEQNSNEMEYADNIVRGIYSPYIGLISPTTLFKGFNLIDIKIPGYSELNLNEYIDIRCTDNSEYFSISNRFDIIKDIDSDNFTEPIYGGDCYICNFTHRMIRNFQDPDTPINDEIVEPTTWIDHYKWGDDEDKWQGEELTSSQHRALINRGDVNAVQIGHWVTFKCCSNYNLSLRTTNPYYPEEQGLTGKERSFYPLSGFDYSGSGKIPESNLINKGHSNNSSTKKHIQITSITSNQFKNRILYSNVSGIDSLENGYKVIKDMNYRDYPLTYGSITKLVEWNGYIICIFEHGVGVIPINERAIASQAEGGNTYINTSTILPENPLIISDMFGSQWKDSIVKTPYGIYGVDTVAKKIWKVMYTSKNFQIAVLSDFKVQSFLNDNISLSERELTPLIGIRNVKTHYNAFKNDIMFTFYDDINTIEEKVWNLCYNEVLERFVTFYSWVPSFSENIDNIFFTFDRNASKNIVKLNSNKNLITLNNKVDNIENIKPDTTAKTLIGTLQLNGYTEYDIVYSIADDLKNALFTVDGNNLYVKTDYIETSKNSSTLWEIPIKAIITSKLNNTTVEVNSIEDKILIPSKNYLKSVENTYFWKHGQAGLTKTKDDIKPCHWYGKQHPFEFEFVVVENPVIAKIFTNMQILSNKTAPESLHFEISGEVYNFANDKKNIFFRQEALKNLYQYYGGDITFDHNYLKIIPEQRDIPYSNSIYKDKSTMFPLYFSRINTINEIEDYYQKKSNIGKDYQRISGSEIVYNKTSNQYNIVTHIKACPFNSQYEQLISKEKYEELKNKGYNNIKQVDKKINKSIDELTYYALYDNNEDVYIQYDKIDESTLERVTETSIKDFRDINSIIYVNEDFSEELIYIETIDGIDISYRNLRFFKVETETFYYEIKQYGRLNGNMHYRDDNWDIQIPSIVYWQKNEKEWKNNYPPLNIANNPLPESMSEGVSIDSLPKNLTKLGYTTDMTSFDTSIWNNTRKETRLRDKYLRVKVRYSGEDLAIIHAIRTMFTVSYT